MNLVLSSVLYSLLLTGQMQAPALGTPSGDSGMMPRQPMLQPEVPVVGGVEHYGWGLSGSAGRHYFFGGIGFADYTTSGQRSVVSLQEETDSALPDRNTFLYYREIGTGNRWAISKHAEGGFYAVYYQPYQDPRVAPVQGRSRWQMFQNAQLIEDTRSKQQRSSIPEQGMAREGDRFIPRANAPRTLLPEAQAPAVRAPAIVQNVPRQYNQGPTGTEQYVQPRFTQPQRQYIQPSAKYVYVESGSCCGN